MWFSTQDAGHCGNFVFVTWESCCGLNVVTVGSLIDGQWQPIGSLGLGDWEAVAWAWISYPEPFNG